MNKLNLLSSWAGIKEYFAPRSAQGYLNANQVLALLAAQQTAMQNRQPVAQVMISQNRQLVAQVMIHSQNHRLVVHRAVATTSNQQMRLCQKSGFSQIMSPRIYFGG